MDTLLPEFPSSINTLKFNHCSTSCSSNRNLCPGYNKLSHNFSSPDPPFQPMEPEPHNDSSSASSPSNSSEGDYPSNNAIFKYISDMLMEEDLEGKTCMLQDSLALQAAEKSFYDVLGQEYPNSLDRFPPCFIDVGSPDGSLTWNSSIDSSNSSSSSSSYQISHMSVEKPFWFFDEANTGLSHTQSSFMNTSQSSLLGLDFNSQMHPFGAVRRGMTEGGQLLAVADSNSLIFAPNAILLESVVKEERDNSPNSSRGRKYHQRDDSDDLEEERSNKHSALSLQESELSEMFDAILLCRGESNDSGSCNLLDKSPSPVGSSSGGNEQKKRSNGKTTRPKKQANGGEIVDLWSLLIQCAQAVSSCDQRTATELLKQIRQHSSPSGDGNQRMAYYFANALETRLAGTGTPMYTAFVSNKTPLVDILKAYQTYVRACPFKRMSNFFANRTIIKRAKKATRLHIIDFGILYGFQWPCLIQKLSERSGGPPTLCITGIELPQPGFRPTERVEETGRRLRRYCERFNVPFEFHVIAKKWETIKYEDFNIDRDEMIVVNCSYRLRNLPDDTMVANSARDRVLRLIKRINPDIFINGVVNGTYNAPFFVTRFKEALFHFSSYFDMFEVNVPQEDEQRGIYEKEVFGKEIMNVIASEGTQRVQRPETYKQWQVRNLRAGFRQLPLDKEILKSVKSTVKAEYDKNFVVDEDGQWMLQGWKGRIMYALSVWQTVQ